MGKITDRYTLNYDPNNLLLVLGDSWSWGDSLKNRIQDTYASILAEKLGFSLINNSVCGCSNFDILDRLSQELKNIDAKKYNKIIIILGLTETGREWHRYQIPTNDIDNKFKMIEQSTVDRIDFLSKLLPNNVQLIVSRNFTNFYPETTLHNNKFFTRKIWCEIISQKCKVEWPITYGPISGCVFESMLSRYKNDASFKSWFSEKIDLAQKTWDWLDNSPYNYKKFTKHPTEEGHVLWAEYLLFLIKEFKLNEK